MRAHTPTQCHRFGKRTAFTPNEWFGFRFGFPILTRISNYFDSFDDLFWRCNSYEWMSQWWAAAHTHVKRTVERWWWLIVSIFIKSFTCSFDLSCCSSRVSIAWCVCFFCFTPYTDTCIESILSAQALALETHKKNSIQTANRSCYRWSNGGAIMEREREIQSFQT